MCNRCYLWARRAAKAHTMTWDKPEVPNVGQLVEIYGLQRRIDLNGCHAFVEKHDADERVSLVVAATQEVVRAKSANVKCVRAALN